jgi:hypothetical protein
LEPQESEMVQALGDSFNFNTLRVSLYPPRSKWVNDEMLMDRMSNLRFMRLQTSHLCILRIL